MMKRQEKPAAVEAALKRSQGKKKGSKVNSQPQAVASASQSNNNSVTTAATTTATSDAAAVETQHAQFDPQQFLAPVPDASTSTAAAAEAQLDSSGFDLEQFLAQSPWLVLPGEISTGAAVDPATGQSYLFLHNCPADGNYVALDINDGHELAAGGDREYLVEYIQAHLNEGGRYHVVVIPETNVQRAGVPRWQVKADWMDHVVLEEDKKEIDDKTSVGGDEEEKGKINKGKGKETQQDSSVATSSRAEDRGGEDQGPFQAVEPPISSFLSQKIYAEPATSQQQQHASSSKQEAIQPHQGDLLRHEHSRGQFHQGTRLPHGYPRSQSIETSPRPLSYAELALLQEFVHSGLSRLEAELHAAEVPLFEQHHLEEVVDRVHQFFHQQCQLKQDSGAPCECHCNRCVASAASVNLSGDPRRFFRLNPPYASNNNNNMAPPPATAAQRCPCMPSGADFVAAGTPPFFGRWKRAHVCCRERGGPSGR